MAHNESTGEPAGTGRDPFDLIRLQDPAAGAAPDLAALRRRIDARIEADGIGDDLFAADSAGGVRAMVLDLDEARTRRSGQRRWLQVAAAAVGVMAVGLGGYLVGNTGSTGQSDIAAPTVVAPSAPAGSPETADPTTSATTPGANRGSVPPTPGADVPPNAMAGGGADTKMMVGNRTVFTAGSGLSSQTGQAQGWTLDPASVFSKKTVATVARELGVAGTPRLENGSWNVGPVDGSGPAVQLMPDGAANVSYSDPSKDPYRCAGDTSATCTVTGVAPTGAAAITEATTLLGSLGVDTSTVTFTVPDPMDTSLTTVMAEVTVGDAPSGLTWSVGLVADGVQSLYGPLAPVVPLGDLPVISPVEAVARLSDPRFGTTGPVLFDGGTVTGAADDGGAVSGATVADPTPPAVLQPGAPIAWPVDRVTISGSSLAVTQQFQQDGAVLLLPAYHLTDDAGSTWTVIAAADSAFDFQG
ncbi:hypothetical protein D1871_11765 [Nakamurella silvestris]|nr:hypothetical protein D1871_11765 [Nakamurella silvestris]